MQRKSPLYGFLLSAGSVEGDGRVWLTGRAAALLGRRRPKGVVLDGFDMLPVLSGKRPLPRRAIYWDLRAERAARLGRFKWIDGTKGRGLFELEADPGEEHDLSTDQPDVLETLTARFKAWQREMQAAEPRGPLPDY